jgi:cysteinyl-tRNA synthetase, unknown class
MQGWRANNSERGGGWRAAGLALRGRLTTSPFMRAAVASLALLVTPVGPGPVRAQDGKARPSSTEEPPKLPIPVLSHSGRQSAAPSGGSVGQPAIPSPAPQRKMTLQQAESWGYQLQALDEKGFAALFYDVLVMDYTKGGQTGTEFTAAELDKIRVKPNGQRRILLSYFSVGEAESYRYYWKPEWKAKKPAWISHENKDWAGNYIIRFWDPQWRQIVYDSADSYLSRIIAAGFDGVYLDRVDVYAELEKENSNARADMIGFVRALSAKAKSLKRDFQVVVQNAEELSLSDPFLTAIDAIAKEDLLYGIDHKATRNPQGTINEAVRHLKHARDKGKGVFVVEYLSRPDQVMGVMRELARYDERFVPHFADRNLNRVRAERFEDMAHEDDEEPRKAVN